MSATLPLRPNKHKSNFHDHWVTHCLPCVIFKNHKADICNFQDHCTVSHATYMTQKAYICNICVYLFIVTYFSCVTFKTQKAYTFNYDHCFTVSHVTFRTQNAYICNFRDHWFSVRKLGHQWFNLNSLLTGPELISDTYLTLFLTQLQQEGQSPWLYATEVYL